MIQIEEGMFHPELPRYIRRMLPMHQQRYLRTYKGARRTYRFRVDCGALYWPPTAISERKAWLCETGAKGWVHRVVDYGPRERRGRSHFLFDREVDAFAFVIQWG